MSEQPRDVGERIESAIRMLNTARAEHKAGHVDDAREFLTAAQRRIVSALNSLEEAEKVIPFHSTVIKPEGETHVR